MMKNGLFVALILVIMAMMLVVSCGAVQPTATEPPIAVDTTAPTDTLLPTDTPIPTEPPSPPTEMPEPQPRDRTWPTKRESFAMAYDPQIDRVLLLNGYDERVGGFAWQHEMDMKARDEWAYDVGANRLELWAVAPAVIYQQIVYDSHAQKLISFGPENTRVYNVATRTWEKTNPAQEPPAFRFWYDLAYDSQSDRTILFGGFGDPIQLYDTWAYDYETNTWTEMSPQIHPDGRWGYAMAYDAESDRVILWGASEVGRTHMSEEEKATVWAYDYESNTWTAIESTGGPSYRGFHTMVYHPGTDRIILFGGHHLEDLEFSDETWAYDYNTNTWTQLTPTTHPSGRRLHSMVYDEAADKMVLFGGIAGNWLKEEINDELWIFDPVAEEWSQVLPETVVQESPAEAATGITVTFEGDQCVYHGPERVPAGQISLTLDVRDQSAHEKYWVIAYTLDEGKTIEDLRAWKSVGHSPLWVGFHGMLDEQPAGTMQETTIIVFEGPLFLACITEPPGYITDVLGPIEIEPAGSK